MDKEMVYNATAAWVGAIVTCMFGSWSYLMGVLVMLVVLDYVTGLMKAKKNKKLSSDVGYRGLMKKSGIFMALVVAHQADITSGMDNPVLMTAAIYFYIANEGLSVLENLAQMGVPLPQSLIKVFESIDDERKGA